MQEISLVSFSGVFALRDGVSEKEFLPRLHAFLQHFIDMGFATSYRVMRREAMVGMSQSRRAMVECIFGWGKQHGTMRKTKHRGIARVAADFLLNLIAYNLIRIPKLLAA